RLQAALAEHERLALIDNQWALVKAGHVSMTQFLSLLDGYRQENDRAVIAAITDHVGWLDVQAVAESDLAAFHAFVDAYYEPQFARLGWDPQPEESADE